MADLGLVIVYEEQDSSYKQEDVVFYNARDMAVVRARLGDFPIVLASATPSLERKRVSRMFVSGTALSEVFGIRQSTSASRPLRGRRAGAPGFPWCA